MKRIGFREGSHITRALGDCVSLPATIEFSKGVCIRERLPWASCGEAPPRQLEVVGVTRMGRGRVIETLAPAQLLRLRCPENRKYPKGMGD